MFWAHLLFAFIFALIFSGILAYALGWRHPAKSDAVGDSLLFLFLILLLAMWAGGAWVPAWGPVVYGTPWLSILVIGLLVSLLILAIAVPPQRTRTPREEIRREPEESIVVGTVFALFFWLLVAGLLVSVLVSYII
jgi:hypothetical protein